MILREWFKPMGTFQADGRAWVDNGHMAVAIDAPPDGLKVRPNPPACLSEPTVLAERTAERRGCAIFNGDEQCVYAAHALDLAEMAHPGLVWLRTTETMPTLIGVVDGKSVAAVAPRRGLPADGERVYPPCPVCSGDGKTLDCDTCGGSGEHGCTCGDEHECSDCDGTGRVGRCEPCGGSGRWTPTTKAA